LELRQSANSATRPWAPSTRFCNLGVVEFWSRYGKLPDAAAPKDALPAMSALKTAALARVTAKTAAPQEAVSRSAAFDQAVRQLDAARKTVDAYNTAIA
jgi:hypothetical protein